MLYRTRLSGAVFSLCLLPAALTAQTVITEGLQAPQRLVATTGGSFLVTETSMFANSGRISLVTKGGNRRTLLDGLPSGTTATAEGSGPTGLLLQGQTLYIAIGPGDAERNGPRQGTTVWNPEGISSPIFSSILQFRLSSAPDMLNGPFVLTPAQQIELANGFEVELRDTAGSTVTASVLADFPDLSPDPNTIYRGSNPWALESSADGATLYLADASMNALVLIDTATGKWRRQVTFPPLPNPRPGVPPVVDAVPTSVRRYGDRVLMGFLTGFPFVPGYARVLSVDPVTKQSDPFIFNLSSVTDIAYRDRPGARTQFFVLEFSQNQLAGTPGRLLRYDTPDPTVVSDTLVTPVSMVIDAAENTAYVLELRGRIVKVPLQ